MPRKRNDRRTIPTPVVPDQTTRFVKFSFKYFDAESEIFRLDACPNQFLIALLQKIREYSSWTLELFIDPNNDEYRHPIDFAQTDFPDGFVNVNLEQLAWEEAWQFGLGPRGDWEKQNWRVHGILLEDTFFVIWLDRNHELYRRRNQT